jgi:hypothetical protein
VADFLVAHADTRTADGRQRLVRHRHLRERPIMTGIGPIEVRVPRVRDRLGSADDRIRFNSAILPPYARRSFNRAMVEADSPRRSGRAMQQAPCRHRSDAGISPFPPKELLHKPGSSTTPASQTLAVTRPSMLPSALATASVPRILILRSMAGLGVPLPMLRCYPCADLHGTTPCRSQQRTAKHSLRHP